MKRTRVSLIIFLMFYLIIVFPCDAKIVQYDLSISYKVLSIAGKEIESLAVNDSIHGPALNFREGDVARILFKNNTDTAASVHWHGLVLPSGQDGAPPAIDPIIEPGETKKFEFTIQQSGTHWFHIHAGLKKQRGVFGSIIISPKEGERVLSDRSEVIALMDWTNDDPDEVLRTLKSGNDYYSLKKGSMQSLLGAAKAGALLDTFKRSFMRMPPMDISDVANDGFLSNGEPEMSIPARPGERVRLRFINTAATTYFYLQFAGGPVQVVSADGRDVQPVELGRFLIAIGETYDLLVTVPEGGAFEFRATAQDGTGHTSVFIGEGNRIFAPDVKKPNLYKMSMKGMGGDSERPMAPYRKLRSLHKTSLPAGVPPREIVLTLSGDMERYIWSLDGKEVFPDKIIRVRHGESTRFVLVNKTMMHHPLHLHGHYFRVINGQGDYAPLKHTVDIPPMTTRVIEFENKENKTWSFHCHVLYHVLSGMALEVSYQDEEIDPDLPEILKELYKDPWYSWIDGTIQSHMTDGTATFSNSKNIFSADWEIGWQEVDETEHDIELAYDRYFNRFLTAFAGGNFTNDFERGIFGVRTLLPFNFESTARIDTAGEFRVTIGQSLHLTSRLGVFGDFEYDTESKKEWVAGARYTLSRNFSLVGQYHSEFGAGAGIRFRF
jgi:FtsP/CotA-like multicopper oxidase with cupredoxin domain